jgi:hypothetical protein
MIRRKSVSNNDKSSHPASPQCSVFAARWATYSPQSLAKQLIAPIMPAGSIPEAHKPRLVNLSPYSENACEAKRQETLAVSDPFSSIAPVQKSSIGVLPPPLSESLAAG